MPGRHKFVMRVAAAALLLWWASALAGGSSSHPAGSPGQECRQGGTVPPRPPAALRALPWALAAAIGAAGCIWLLRTHRTHRRQRQHTQDLAPDPAPATQPASTGGQSQSGGSTPPSVVLQRSADGTILSPFYRDSSLPPFSGSSSAGTPRGELSIGSLAAGTVVAKRLADLLVHPGAGSLQQPPWPPPIGRDALALQHPAAAPPAAEPCVDTPTGSAERLQQPASAAGTAQSVSGSSLPVPWGGSGGGGGGHYAAPPPELAWHVAAVQQEEPLPHLNTASSKQQQPALSVSALPPRLRELFVDPSKIEVVPGLRGRLGEGASGYVIKARFQQDMVAAKVFDLSKSRELRESFLTECSRLAHLRHPNIITLLGISLTRNKGIMLLELAEGRDLFSALQISGRGPRSSRVFGWWRQGARVALEIARAVNHCHHKGYVHGDIKSSNVLLCGSGTAKLADVAFSRRIEPPPPELETCDSVTFEPPPLSGTFAWMAPEVLLGSPFTPAADIYSFGVVLHEIITGEQPLRGSLRMPRVPEECPQEACDLMMRCLSVEPAGRPSAGELLQDLSRLKRRNSMDVHAAAEWGTPAVADQRAGTLRRCASLKGLA